MAHESKPPIPMTGPDPVLTHMKACGLPITLQSSLEYAYPEGPPDPLPGELLQTIPPELWTWELISRQRASP